MNMNLTQWIKNPARTYKDGVAIYHKVKKNSKFDKLFAQVEDSKQGELHFNYLFKELSRLNRTAAQQNAAPEEEKPTIAVKPLLKKEAPAASNRPKFHEERYDVNELSPEMRVKYERNKAIIKAMAALHEKMKAVDPDPKNDQVRAELRKEIDGLDSERNKNWKAIDSWWKKRESGNDSPSAAELVNKVQAAKRYIGRFGESKDPKVIAKCADYTKFLKESGINWTPSKKK